MIIINISDVNKHTSLSEKSGNICMFSSLPVSIPVLLRVESRSKSNGPERNELCVPIKCDCKRNRKTVGIHYHITKTLYRFVKLQHPDLQKKEA